MQSVLPVSGLVPFGWRNPDISARERQQNNDHAGGRDIIETDDHFGTEDKRRAH